MTIDALVKVIPPPNEPLEAFVGPWVAVEAKLGTPLPHDYKEFIRRYGNGLLLDFIWISVPLSDSDNCLERGVPLVNRIFATEFPDFPYAIWPDPGGVLPFGTSEDGGYLFWRMTGPPSEWSIVAWGREFETCEVFDCGLAEFLVGVATGAFRPAHFPRDLTSCAHPFRSVVPF